MKSNMKILYIFKNCQELSKF